MTFFAFWKALGGRRIELRPFKRRSYALVEWWREDTDYVLRMADGRAYRGDCTVWHDYATAIRMSTWAESRLCNVWQLVVWGRENDKKRKAKPTQEKLT